LHFFIKTLATLELDDANIGDEGVKYLADALRYNKVTLDFSHFHFYLFISNRHFLNSVLHPINSEKKDQNIWLMLYELTQ